MSDKNIPLAVDEQVDFRIHLMQFFRLLSEELTPGELLKKFLNLLMNLQNVERGSVWVLNGENYECIHAAGEESDTVHGLKVPTSKNSIVGWVMQNARMTVAEAGKDKRHFKEVEEALSVKSNLILAFPLILKSGEVYGCVEIIDTARGSSRMMLDKRYLGLLQSFVDVCSILLSNAIDVHERLEEAQELKQTIQVMRQKSMIVGPSRLFEDVVKRVQSYAGTEYPVLLTGESGTGKEIVAAEIHRRSRRAGAPFIVQNCSAIPTTLLISELFGYKKGAFTGADTDKMGLFEAADGGTLFLDEIGDTTPEFQAALLRVLQENEIKPLGGNETKSVDVRIIAATNKNLDLVSQEGEFRRDLFYRLNVLPMELPPLRTRPEDISYFITHFIAREAAFLGIPAKHPDPEAMTSLMSYDWPGNVRELENCVKQLMVAVLEETIHAEDLPANIRGTAADALDSPEHAAGLAVTQSMHDMTWEDMERWYVLHVMEQNNGVVSDAARQAGLNRSTFDSRLKRLGLK